LPAVSTKKMKSKISLIAALSENRAIGKGNQLIWKIPEDLKRFREITFGHPVIMGRKTFESIGKLLPNRTNIIITRDKEYKIKGAIIVHSFEEALSTARDVILNLSNSLRINSVKNLGGYRDPSVATLSQDDNARREEIFIIGGGQIFEQAIKIADKLYLTIIEKEFKGDTFFPDYSSFKKVSESEIKKFQGIKYRFEEWEK